ncbi:MFS transporter (macronuclear) [Tetrahymena thermophila SB210]|uniref:MFS transporter n=1 Tax=Tetrahymena thermophila (strain SB210) TaxID=312017 RepID=Q245S6_TETTS|nr:MFS transporter [Tetrahymena thermophila SB210]EAS03557.2 MFS transporter [Tetrahymena thermophila SB210]|eukprot:XP_001023802.2 MFS transporter [Tetrahymena thermophila SB210]
MNPNQSIASTITQKQNHLIVDPKGSIQEDNAYRLPSVQQEEYKEYPYRFVVLVGFLLITTTYSLSTSVFNPISAIVADIYGVPPIVVAMNMLILHLLHLPLSFPIGYFIEKFGLTVSVWVSTTLMLVAVWIRTLINTNYFIVLGAHIILAIGYPFNQNLVTKIGLVWFRTEKRQMITQIVMVTTLVTILGGSLMPGLWMKDYNEDQDELDGYKDGKDKILLLMKVQAYLTSALAIPGLLMFREKPPTPPSFTAETKRDTFKQSVKSLFKNKQYLINFLAFGFFSGSFMAGGVTISFIFKPFGFGSDITSYAGIVIVFSGMIGSGIGGKMFRDKPNFKLYLFIGLIGSIIGYGLTMAMLPTEKVYLILLPYVIIGLSSLQAFPIFLELASEQAYPVPEEMSSGLLQGSSQICGFIFGGIYTTLLDGENRGMCMVVLICYMGVFAASLVLVKIMKIDLKRTKEDAKFEKDLKILEQNGQQAQQNDYDNQINIPPSNNISANINPNTIRL